MASKNIKMVKLISGDVVIGELIEENESTFKLKKPVELRFEAMLGGLSFLPYMAVYLGKELEEMDFRKDLVMHEIENDDIPVEIEGKYREYLSGIVTPASANDTNIPSIHDMLAGKN